MQPSLSELSLFFKSEAEKPKLIFSSPNLWYVVKLFEIYDFSKQKKNNNIKYLFANDMENILKM